MSSGASGTDKTVPENSTSRTTNNEEPLPPVVKLTSAFGNVQPVQLLQATLEYATSPKNYVHRVLGPELVEARSQYLSLPEEPVDRDIYGTGKHKQHFEQHIATLLGKKHGLFFLTGVQAQLTACKIYCKAANKDRVAWHYRSHLEIAEERAYDEVFHFQRTFIGSSQLEVPTVEDVKAVTSLPEDERPTVMILELPNRELGCKTYPWDDLVEISKSCKAANIKLHMDGARLWEIEPYYQHNHNKSFADVAALFDSVYVSFYKGLRGVCGAVLTSSDESFIAAAKTWQRRLGGNTVANYNEVLDCERGFNTNIGTFYTKWQKMRSVAKAMIDATAEFRTKDGKPMVYFNPSDPTCAQIHTHIQGVTAERLKAARDAVEKEHRIRVFAAIRPWQNPKEQKKAELVSEDGGLPTEGAVPEKENPQEKPQEEVMHHMFEWMIMEEGLGIADEVFAKGWKALCQHLVKAE